MTTKTLENGEGKDYGKARDLVPRKPREPAAVKLEETGQGQDSNDRGRQGRGGARLRKNLPLMVILFWLRA